MFLTKTLDPEKSIASFKVEDFVNMFGEAKLLLSQHGTLGMDFPLKEFRNTVNPFCTVEVDTFKEYMIQQFENL